MTQETDENTIKLVNSNTKHLINSSLFKKKSI